ncbi:MAG TPA: tetratricopeptide repeat protein [Sphingomonas sp.]|nr:tetratricopeptide repeat protein [Sphingomonas sp.]
MKTLSKIALAALLTSSLGGIAVAVPAAAQKQKKEEQKPGMKLSKPVAAIAKSAQDAIAAKNFAVAEPILVQVETAATTDDDKYVAAALRYDLENQKLAAAQAANPNAPLDQTSLAKPLDMLIAAKNTPAADRARYLYRRGQLASIGGQHQVAAQYYQQAKTAGYTDPDFELQFIKTKFQSGDVAGGLTDLESEVGKQEAAGKKAPEAYYRYAIAQANQKQLKPQTMTWLKKYIAAYPSAANWRAILITYGLQPASVAKLDKNQTIDLFRLLRASGSLADQALYQEYAQSVYDRGLPYEAQAVIKEGRASGKLAATNANDSALLAESTRAIRDEGSLAGQEKGALASKDGKLASQVGDAYLGQGNYAKAVELYRAALTKGGVDADEVNTRLGIALARSGDKPGATSAFALVKAEPRAGLAQLWSPYVAVGSTPSAPGAPS